MARGIIMATACKLHLELIYKHDKRSVWDLWVAIDDNTIRIWNSETRPTRDRLHKTADKGYMEYLTSLTDARDRIDRVTPARMSHEERMDELVLFACLCGLADDPMRRQLVAQKNVSPADTQGS